MVRTKLAIVAAMGLLVAGLAAAGDSGQKEPAKLNPNDAVLFKKVSGEFNDAPLKEVAKFWRDFCKVDIVVSEAAKDVPITFSFKDMTVSLAMEWIARLCECKFVVKDGKVLISSAKDIEDIKAGKAQFVPAKEDAGEKAVAVEKKLEQKVEGKTVASGRRTFSVNGTTYAMTITDSGRTFEVNGKPVTEEQLKRQDLTAHALLTDEVKGSSVRVFAVNDKVLTEEQLKKENPDLHEKLMRMVRDAGAPPKEDAGGKDKPEAK